LKNKTKTINKIVQTIKENEEYKNFNLKYSELYKQKKAGKSKNRVISYMKEKGLKKMNVISFDIKEGNFNSFKMVKDTPEILNYPCYEDMFFSIAGKNDLTEILVKSKGLRQVIFGQLNPKLTTKILTEYIGQIFFDKDIVVESQDERVFVTEEDLNVCLPYIKKEKIEIKLVDEIPSVKKECLKKYYLENGKRLKGVPKNEYIAMYKKYVLGSPLEDKDFYYEENGNIVRKIFI
jgi:hypothetical protein